MGSVSSNIECVRCGSEEAFEDYNYKSGECFTSCPDCGRTENHYYKRDDEGKYLRVDETKDFTYDNLIPVNDIVDNPYAAFRIDHERHGECGHLLTKEDYEDFVAHVISFINQPNDVVFASTSRFEDGKIIKECLYAKKNEE
jgi:predicted  nucleic acid-binding Zn-ribbon protein